MSYDGFFQFIRQKVAQRVPLESIERLVAAASPNFTNEDATCLEIEIPDVGSFEHWSPAHGSWIVRGNNGDISRPFVVALITPAGESCPLARAYFSQLSHAEAEQFIVKKKATKVQVIHVESQTHLDNLVDAIGAGRRIREYQARYNSKPNGSLSPYLEGRVANTFVSHVDVLDSGSACLVCEKPGHKIMLTSVGQPGHTAASICFLLCEEHSEEAQRGFLVDFLTKKFNLPATFEIVPIEETDATARLCRKALEELECVLIKEDLPRQTFYGRRGSGFEVILRCYTQESDSYAYMVLTPPGPSGKQKNVRRIDDAKDHPEQPYLWDHRHKGLPRNNKEVEPSFTFGMPIADLKAIRREIEEAEALTSGSPPV